MHRQMVKEDFDMKDSLTIFWNLFLSLQKRTINELQNFILPVRSTADHLFLRFRQRERTNTDNYKYSLYEFVEDYSSQTGTDGTDIEFTINLGCGDSGQYTCYNKTIDGTQYLASPIITDRNGKNVTSGTLKFASDGFKLTIPDYGEGQYLTYGLFEYGTKTFADKTDKGYISLADLSVVRK